LKDIFKQTLLYDFYGELLTKHQKKIYEDFVFNDLSLSEIADEEGITRQGVHDLVKRCDKALQGYEDKLHLVEKFHDTKKDVEKIKELTEKIESENEIKYVKDIYELADKILGEI